jgi:hypothetical protein
MGRGSGHKYRVKWINLSEEHICYYGANHGLLQDPSKEQPLKVQKIHGLQRLSQEQAKSSHVGTNTVDALEFYPHSGEISDAYDDDPQFPGISPLQIGYNVLRMDPSFYCLDQRFPCLISSHSTFIAFVEKIRA